MAEVFISYARANLEQVRQVVEALRAENLEVWWDQDIPANAEWDPTIEAQLDAAKTVVVCWSKTSAGSENVRAEARFARNKGRLLQAYMEPCSPPFFFGERQGADLSKWDGDRGADRFQFLAEGVRDLLAGRKPKPGLGYRPRPSQAPLIIFAACALIAASAAAVLWIPEVRDRVFPPRPVTWTMSAGVSADFRPALPPTARPIDRMTSPMLIGLSPEFSASGRSGAHARISRERVTLSIPNAERVVFEWLWFTDNINGATYIRRLGNAAPFVVQDAGAREITFQPTSGYLWSDFVRDLNRATSSGDQLMIVSVEADATNELNEMRLIAVCAVPVRHALLVIQDRKLDLESITIPCGASVPGQSPRADAGAGE